MGIRGTGGNARRKYHWGNDVGINKPNCDGFGSRWDDKSTAPVGSFAANAFGLFDTAGNVWELVADCWNENYEGAPADGSAWTSGDCDAPRGARRRCHGSYVPRGDGFFIEATADPRQLRRRGSADFFLGFRGARTLD